MPVGKGQPSAQQPSTAPHCLHGKDQTSKLAVGQGLPHRSLASAVLLPHITALTQ
ncbi:mCG147040 [Mus musculus]|nr:mCG147040 [Mus musculus]